VLWFIVGAGEEGIHNGYFDCRGSFKTVIDSYYCIMG